MADVLTRQQRSRCMSAISCKDTTPELLVRSMLRSVPCRYSINDPNLPGKPDIVFKRCKKAIFVHGCFWHRHNCRAGRSVPSTRTKFWTDKLTENKSRDGRQIAKLRRMGWGVMIVWQCKLKGRKARSVLARVVNFLQKRAS